MISRILTFAFFCSALQVFAGDTIRLSIQDCYKIINNHCLMLKNIQYNHQISQIRLENLKKAFYPTLDLNGQASYQSDVVSINVSIPQMGNLDFPSASKDQFKATLDLNQIIYDGGMNKLQRKIEEENSKNEICNLEIQVYQLKDRVSQTYFMMLMLDAKERILNVAMNDLKSKRNQIATGVKNGISLQVNQDLIDAEILKIQQQIIENNEGRQLAAKTLELIMDTSFQSYILPAIPVNSIQQDAPNNRSELKYYDLQSSKFQLFENSTYCKRRPKIISFAQIGYGKPGLMMISNKWDSYYIIGAKITWNLWDWNQNKNERQIYKIQSEMIKTQKSIFQQNLDISMEKEFNEIEKLEKLIEKDYEIVAIRKKITKSYSTQLDNGIINSSEYTTQVNAEAQALLNLELHLLMKQQAFNNVIYLKGNAK